MDAVLWLATGIIIGATVVWIAASKGKEDAAAAWGEDLKSWGSVRHHPQSFYDWELEDHDVIVRRREPRR